MTIFFITAIKLVSYLVYLYMLILLIRVLLDWLHFFLGDYRPPGVLLVLANIVYAVTDPPINFFGKYVPPLRLGAIALDMGFLVLFFLLYFMNYLLQILMYSLFRTL